MNSPLRYPGGKSRATRQLLQYFPAHIPEYRECFLGGGSVYLAAHERIENAWLNDIYAPLMAFWGAVQHDAYRLADALEANVLPLTPRQRREMWETLTDEGLRRTSSQFKLAQEFFFINRVSYSGTAESGGYSSTAATERLTPASVERVRALDGALDNASLTCDDYAPMLQGEGAFIYLDPPYVTPQTGLYGKKGALHRSFSHELLRDRLMDCKHDWLLSYDDCDTVRKLYGECDIQPLEGWKYGNGKQGKEVVIRPTGRVRKVA